MGLWLILCNRSASVVGSALSETAEWTSADGPWTLHAESKAVAFSNSFIFLRSHKKKKSRRRQMPDTWAPPWCRGAKPSGLLKAWCRNVAFQMLTSFLTHVRGAKGSVCQIWQHFILKRHIAKTWVPDNVWLQHAKQGTTWYPRPDWKSSLQTIDWIYRWLAVQISEKNPQQNRTEILLVGLSRPL